MDGHIRLQVAGVYIGGGGAVVSEPQSEIICDLGGIQGDRHYGFTKSAGVREKKFHPKGASIWNPRTWSAVSVEELAEIAASMGVAEIKAEWLGANLLFRGVGSLTSLPPMTRLVFSSGAILLVYGENLPCIGPANVIRKLATPLDIRLPQTFGKAAAKKRGLVGWVERAGVIRPGDTADVYLP
ncbi:putative metal-sulfur cluster biosynthesis proteins YuaD [Capsulimonas corticalis]|uniref:Metal-sulfur cluster biosynthesis proteins YuaD n=1 Tax=Capsulimonas corticalis TaxID=2219043 RepID=A0A402CRL9_9BACT|nr:MOSC domain-containing protein [Capsulimonas corticalis]BDI28090.1 putative metal-sulfur cluster biosynthesis proteins YuaD [Capsulimonas corticalis]